MSRVAEFDLRRRMKIQQKARSRAVTGVFRGSRAHRSMHGSSVNRVRKLCLRLQRCLSRASYAQPVSRPEPVVLNLEF